MSETEMSVLGIPNTPTCPCCGGAVDPHNVLLDEDSCVVSHRGSSVKLTRTEFSLLKILLIRRPALVAKDAMYEWLYGLHRECDRPEPKIIDVLVCKARAKLKLVGIAITTQWGFGHGVAFETDDKPIGDIEIYSGHTDGRKPKRWSEADDAMFSDLRRRGFALAQCATVMKKPYIAIDRAATRLGLRFGDKAKRS